MTKLDDFGKIDDPLEKFKFFLAHVKENNYEKFKLDFYPLFQGTDDLVIWDTFSNNCEAVSLNWNHINMNDASQQERIEIINTLSSNFFQILSNTSHYRRSEFLTCLISLSGTVGLLSEKLPKTHSNLFKYF